VSGGLRVLTSGAAAEDAVLTRSGPLLAVSAGDWLGGGGIGGLRALAATLYGSVPAIAAGAQAEDGQAGQGDPAAGGALAAVAYQAASIIDDLATELAGIGDALEEQAHTASRYGVRIGTDRRPPPALAVPPGDAAAATERYWTLIYQRAHAQAAADADGARQQAVRQLAELRARLAPPRSSLGPSAAAATGSLTIGQFLTGLCRYLQPGPGHRPNGGGGSSDGASRNGMTAAGRSGEVKMS
jgi:hypothetical protein